MDTSEEDSVTPSPTSEMNMDEDSISTVPPPSESEATARPEPPRIQSTKDAIEINMPLSPSIDKKMDAHKDGGVIAGTPPPPPSAAGTAVGQPEPKTTQLTKSPAIHIKRAFSSFFEKVTEMLNSDEPPVFTDVYEAPTVPNLEKYGSNMCETVSADPIVGRDNEINRVIEILCQRTKNNPILIGDPGVGKTAVVEGLAQRLYDKDVPEQLIGVVLYELDVGLLTAGTQYRGDLEKRITAILDEASRQPVIIFIDEIHVLMAQQSGTSPAELLKPAMARGDIRLIGATTLDEYRTHIEKNPAFQRRMQSVMVEEPNVEQTVALLEKLKDKYETYHTVILDPGALRAAAELSAQYMKTRFNPDKSIDLIDEACSAKSSRFDTLVNEIEAIQTSGKGTEMNALLLREEINYKDIPDLIRFRGWKRARRITRKQKKQLEENKSMMDDLGGIDPTEVVDGAIQKAVEKINKLKEVSAIRNKITVTKKDIQEIVTRATGIPLREETDQLAGMEGRLMARVIGQGDAVRSVVAAIIRTRLSLGDVAKRPTGCFLFAGPTGVGKTEMAKALAHELFGDERHMVRIDMSEYSDISSVSRLIGAAPGYIGHESGGQLTEPVRRRPYNVVLMDEIEKANPKVLTVLLQLMDDGRLTDGMGRTVDFTSTVVILTTNLGYRMFGQQDLSEFVVRRGVMQAIEEVLQPEFINRLDDVILFWPLTQASIRLLAEQAIKALNDRLAARGVQCVADEKAISFIASAAYDPLLGARPLRRVIDRQIVDQIGQLIMQRKISTGQTVMITVADDQLLVAPVGNAGAMVAATSSDASRKRPLDEDGGNKGDEEEEVTQDRKRNRREKKK
jgi:ATP-dependent Clp protease ATP-binding subunit ClpB